MLTTAQAAALKSLSRRTLSRYVKDGLLPAVKVGRDWLINESDLATFKAPKLGRKPKDTTK